MIGSSSRAFGNHLQHSGGEFAGDSEYTLSEQQAVNATIQFWVYQVVVRLRA
jgi:hypothetical protein